jgi:hypothetical protein
LIDKYSNGRRYIAKNKGDLNESATGIQNKDNDRKKKYGNSITVINDIKFQSKLEAKAYNLLKQMIMAKVIKSFEMQVKYCLQEKFRNQLGRIDREINYFADFVVIDNNDKEFVIDTKGFITDIFKIKKKLFEYKFNKPLYSIKSMEALNNLILGGVYNGKKM